MWYIINRVTCGKETGIGNAPRGRTDPAAPVPEAQMETFGPPMPMVPNGRFAEQRQAALRDLADADIDAPIAGLIASINRRAYCFTQQCCFGHFVLTGLAPHNLEPLPRRDPGSPIEYRIAYVAFCLDDGERGRALLGDLGRMAETDPEYVQLGSAAWFRETQVNSYQLQVEPARFKDRDQAFLAFEQALRVELARNRFFTALAGLFGR